MHTTRRDLFKLSAAAAATAAFPALPAPAVAAARPAASGTISRATRPLRLLILGGTGHTGPFHVNHALARGHQVTVFNRGRQPSPDWNGNVEILQGDRNSGDLKALEGREWDACIDIPTSLPFWVRDVGKMLKGRVGHYLFVSTISVYADGSRAGIEEDDALAQYRGADAMAETLESMEADMRNLYGPLKAQSEAEAHRQFGERVSIVRPGFIVGPRDDSDRFTYWVVRTARGGEVLVPGDGRDPVQIIDGRDLAEWNIRLVENRTFGTFNGVGPDHRLTMDAMMHGIHAVTGGPARFTHVPADFLEAQEVNPPIWVSSTGGGPYAGYGQVSNARALAAGLTFRPLATTVADLLAWRRTLPAERQQGLYAGISRDREAEVLRAWRSRAVG